MQRTTTTKPDTEWFTVPQYCRTMGIGLSLGYSLVRDGKIPSRRLGRLIRIPRAATSADGMNEAVRGGR